MVTQPDQVFKKHVLPEKTKNRKNERVAGYCDQRLSDTFHPPGPMLGEICAPKQRSLEKKAPRAARRGHCLMDDGLIAPDESAAFVDHAAEEVHILSRSGKLRPEGSLHAVKDRPLKEHVTGSCFKPV